MPAKRSKAVGCTCVRCGVAFMAVPSAIRRGRRFCSRACGYASRVAPLAERFWKHVDKGDGSGCWLWNGRKRAGYSYGTLSGEASATRRHELAHRVSWRLHFGEIPDGLVVCHRCDVPSCVRPDHLFLGTYRENIQDASRKLRLKHGEQCWSAKLTEADVRTIRARRANGVTAAHLAEQFGIKAATVRHIVRRNTWKHVA